ncbi:MAG: tRNA pseudouridine synthase A [Ignisphaera sp.]|nr:tRNA pseudouridine synthase A [Ignisphaera sp.]MCX8168508.1 tRNA pseudouridine synthase A [Ignisphaera sp.]MDW8085052.1 tRNA pseudouridine synthase A [Ignisphaera sp.]
MKEHGLEFVKRLDTAANIPSNYIIKSEDDTDSKYGHIPTKRPVDLYIKYGLIVLDKPPGPTSHEVVSWIKKMLGISRAGHGGTLELRPFKGLGGETLRLRECCL